MNLQWPLIPPAAWRGGSRAIADRAVFTQFEGGELPAGVVAVKGERAGIRMHNEGTSAGPTGAPWVDSNGWHIRLARMQNPGKTVWVETEAPKPDEIVSVEQYLVGIADAGAYGGRWIVSPDPRFGKELAAGEAEAGARWARITAAAKFFTQHGDWTALPARAVLAVVSDFAGPNEFLNQEILNLAARVQLPYVLIDRTKFSRLPDGLKAVVYADGQEPAPALKVALLEFVRAGGLLIAGPAIAKPDGAQLLPESPTVRYSVYRVGQGRVATTKEMDDPYLVAADAQVLLGHRHDVVRLWNGGSLGAYPTGDAQRTVVHLINYAGRRSNELVTLWIAGKYRNAALFGIENREPVKLDIVPQRGGVELHLPAIPLYAAVEVS